MWMSVIVLLAEPASCFALRRVGALDRIDRRLPEAGEAGREDLIGPLAVELAGDAHQGGAVDGEVRGLADVDWLNGARRRVQGHVARAEVRVDVVAAGPPFLTPNCVARSAWAVGGTPAAS